MLQREMEGGREREEERGGGGEGRREREAGGYTYRLWLLFLMLAVGRERPVVKRTDSGSHLIFCLIPYIYLYIQYLEVYIYILIVLWVQHSFPNLAAFRRRLARRTLPTSRWALRSLSFSCLWSTFAKNEGESFLGRKKTCIFFSQQEVLTDLASFHWPQNPPRLLMVSSYFKPKKYSSEFSWNFAWLSFFFFFWFFFLNRCTVV